MTTTRANMSKGINLNQQKLAEKLIILNDRSQGMLTRVYNIKKACGDSKSKPTFLSDRSLESALKYITKKFPTVDVRGGGAALLPVNSIKQDIVKSLSLYYTTFVDLLDLKVHITELLTLIDACQINLDIALNYDLTVYYLNLVVDYVCMMILLSRVEDRKAVLGLYNTAYEMQNGATDANFPRLGQMIIDYDNPLRKLSEEFGPHQKVLLKALASIVSIYERRNLTAEQLRSYQILSIISAPNQMLIDSKTDTTQCEYFSLDQMDRWIIFALSLCPHALGQQLFANLWKSALESSIVTKICRDEVMHTHQYLQTYFENNKNVNKRDFKDFYANAHQVGAMLHRERRKYLRNALRELSTVLADQPGLLGPKILYVLMALSFARDEIVWLLRHLDDWPQKTGQKMRGREEIVDRQLPEMLFYMEELRSLVLKYSQVIQRYYIQYLFGYDAIHLNELIQRMPSLPEDESVILSSLCQTLSDLTLDGLHSEGTIYDFRGLRLDWCRLQGYCSSDKSPFALQSNPKLACTINTIVFRLKMVDYLEEVLTETSDLSLYCFYTRTFEQHFHDCLSLPTQVRYSCVFPQICSHFVNSLHEACPEERIHIGEKSVSLCNAFLEAMAKETRNVIANICEQERFLSDQILPKNCAKLIADAMKRQKMAASAAQNSEKKAVKRNLVQQPAMPGDESVRRSREEMNVLDKLHFLMVEMCFSIGHYAQIFVWEHSFAPKEYLVQQLEQRFNTAIVYIARNGRPMAKEQDGSKQPELLIRPTELLNAVRAYMTVYQSLECYIHVDMTKIFNNVLLQQTQRTDSRDEETVTSIYTHWFLDVLLKRVSTCHILYSPHVLSFVNNQISGGDSINFNPEEYTDINELKALAELLGAYGVKYLCDRLMWHVVGQIMQLKKSVVQNKETLRAMRSSFEKPEKMRELFRQLTIADVNRKNLDAVDNLLQRMTIIGEILSFRDLLLTALKDVLEDRIPYLFSSILDFKRTFLDDHPDFLNVFEMFTAAGLKCNVDPSLISALKAQKPPQGNEYNPDEDYNISCYLIVFIAVSLPRLARTDSAFFKASLAAHLNNSHCLAKAINEVASALFTLHNRGDIMARMNEFLALASNSLLNIGKDQQERDLIKNKESVYLLLEQIVNESPYLTVDLLESCFPYVLLRSAYHNCYKLEESCSA